jgi:hypothetical protein
MAFGGATISAALADSQAQLQQAIAGGADTGSDVIAQAADAYRASGGGPALAWLGFNPFQVLADGAFHELYWGSVLVFLGIASLVAMQHSLLGRQTLTARHPLAILAQTNFRLLVGSILVANTPLLYGLTTALDEVLSQAFSDMAQTSGELLQVGSMGTLTLAQARIEAIRDAANRRAVALYPSGASRAEMVEIGTWFNAMAAAINPALAAANQAGQLPVLDETTWTESGIPDDRVEAAIGRQVVANFSLVVADLGALPSGSPALEVGFPDGQTSPLAPLSSALAADDAQAAQAVAGAAAAGGQFESARRLYQRDVLSDTLAYLDTQLLPVIGASPTLAQRAQAWFSDRVERAAAAVNPMDGLRSAADWAARSIGIVLTRMVAFFFTAAVRVLIEVDLFLLTLAMPFWLLPSTEEAFYGVLRSLLALSLAVPAYQFIMLFVDALMSLVLRYLLFGPLAVGGTSAAQSAGGAAYGVAAALAVVGSGGEIVGLVTFCYLVTYLFLAVYAARKTPKLVSVFLRGAGAAGMAISTFATGLVAGASAALATAAVAGGGMAAGFLGQFEGGRAGVRGSSTQAAPPVSGANRCPTPPVRAAVRRKAPEAPAAQDPRIGPDRPAWAEAARFGLGALVDALDADNPAEGWKSSAQAWEKHRKQREKEDEARIKAQSQAAKAGSRKQPKE